MSTRSKSTNLIDTTKLSKGLLYHVGIDEDEAGSEHSAKGGAATIRVYERGEELAHMVQIVLNTYGILHAIVKHFVVLPACCLPPSVASSEASTVISSAPLKQEIFIKILLLHVQKPP